ncbi:hypothetical protein EDD22DRAFT_960143 [Suillus occidentalis]|nr:hypothetical protein EDD22DRAFT_960143 [Suillus occidentalis]
MTALDLHNALFTSDKRPVSKPTRPRILSLITAQEQSHSSTSPTYNSPTYHDLLSRQPLHPDGPRHWDLGLDLTGDPITAAECKSLDDRSTKTKLRRLKWTCGAFEVVFGIWAIYCTIRYSLAFQTAFTSNIPIRTLALVLCVVSGISVAEVVVILLIPLLPEDGDGFVRAVRMVLRGCFVVLIFATAIVNLVFVLVWRPVDRCGWDMDVSWSANSTVCRSASLAAWTTVASFRVFATLIMILLYLYFLRAYFEARHPSRYGREMYYPPLMGSEDVVNSPVSSVDPSPTGTHFNKLIEDQVVLGRSYSTLALTNSSVTLAPSSPSHSHVTEPSAPNPIWRNWTNLRLSIKERQRHNSLTDTHTPRVLRRKNRRAISREHILLNANASAGTWEECMNTVGPGSSSRESEHSVSVAEGQGGGRIEAEAMDSETDTNSAYSYGYGATEPAYPYLEIYNPVPAVKANVNVIRSPAAEIIEPAPSLTTVESGEDDMIPIMGGFVRRMTTIQSFGSREAALSIGRSPRSSIGLTPSMVSSLGTTSVYYSASSGGSGAGVGVNERGELPLYGRYGARLSVPC